MQVLLLDPKTLTLHPALAAVPMLQEIAEHFGDPKNHHHDAKRRERGEDAAQAWAAFCQDVATRGVKEPLKVVRIKGGWQVVDGRHRLCAAQKAELQEVPCQHVSSRDIPNIIAANVIGRRHFSKTARAWMAVTMFPQVADAKAGNPQLLLSNNSDSISQTALAVRFGVSQALLSQVCDLYRKYKPSAKLFAQAEWLVWSGASVGGIEAGLGFQSASEADPSKITKTSTWNTAVKAGTGLVRRLEAFEQWQPADRQLFTDHLANEFAKLPTSSRDALYQAVMTADQKAVQTEKAAATAGKAPAAPQGKPTKTEQRFTCPCCQQPGWTRRELKEKHRCPAKDGAPLSKGDLLAAMPSPEIHP